MKDVFSALFTRRWWWATLLVIAMMIVLARLGIWQLDRLQQRRASNAELIASLAADPMDLNSTELPAEIEPLRNRKVEASGHFDLGEQLILLVQNWEGYAGVHLITPLVLEDGQTAVLVDRGWIPDAEADPAGIAQYDINGPTSVDGVIATSEIISRNKDAAPGAPQDKWYRVDVGAIQQQMPYELLPFYVIQAPDGNEQLPYRALPEIDLSDGPHLSYAIQWFIFSIGLGIGYLALVHKNLQKPDAE
jgi:surfeit locus 1 family protein